MNIPTTDNSLLIGVAFFNDSNILQRLIPAAEKTGREVDDVCCILSRQKGPSCWRVDTSHASAWVDGDQIKIIQHNLPTDGKIIWDLQQQRQLFLSGTSGFTRHREFPYPSLQGKTVLLLGDLSALPEAISLALEKIFIANGAREVDFLGLPITSA